jgi:ribonuclease HII
LRGAPRPNEQRSTLPTRDLELHHYASGARCVVGVDEAGRGALAGPVVAAAVAFPPHLCPHGLDDSKKLRPEQRAKLFELILRDASSVSIGVIGPRRIDAINILKASHEAMRRALDAADQPLCVALIDGLAVPALPCPHVPIVKGDSKECCIAAASIIAKVTRDRMMCWYNRVYPHYGFAAHKGYATSVHCAAIVKHGVSPLHRLSFCKRLNLEGDAATTCAQLAIGL